MIQQQNTNGSVENSNYKSAGKYPEQSHNLSVHGQILRNQNQSNYNTSHLISDSTQKSLQRALPNTNLTTEENVILSANKSLNTQNQREIGTPLSFKNSNNVKNIRNMKNFQI